MPFTANELCVFVRAGRAYTVEETTDLMERAGFVDREHQRMSLLNVNSAITGRRL